MKKVFYRPVILSLTLIFVLIAVLQVSFGYFSALDGSKSPSFIIGEWLNKIPEPDDIKEYVENIKYPEDKDMADHVLDTIGEVDGEGNFTIDEAFDDYTMDEIKDIIELIEEFTENFLEIVDGQVKFPEVKVDPIDLNNVGTFAPGEVKYFKQIIHTAELSTNPWYAPVTFQLQLSSLTNQDLSDFSIEILFDNAPFTLQTPFGYEYKLNDYMRNHYKTVVQKIVDENESSNLPLVSNIQYVNRVYSVPRNKELRYLHQYNAPSYTGEWKRFPDGPNFYLSSPITGGSWSGSRQQFVEDTNPNKIPGMTLSGRPEGSLVELFFHLSARKSRSSNSVPIIPITIIISRGLEVDNNNNPLTQKNDLIEPIIKLRVVKGNIYQEGL